MSVNFEVTISKTHINNFFKIISDYFFSEK